MESFSKQSKKEILGHDGFVGPSFFFGLFLASGSYNENGEIEITTDLLELYDYLKKNLKKLLKKHEINENVDEILETIEDFKINKKVFYKFIFKNKILETLFKTINVGEENSIEENISLATM